MDWALRGGAPTGLEECAGVRTWAAARRTRFSSGFRIAGLQPQAGLRPAPFPSGMRDGDGQRGRNETWTAWTLTGKKGIVIRCS